MYSVHFKTGRLGVVEPPEVSDLGAWEGEVEPGQEVGGLHCQGDEGGGRGAPSTPTSSICQLEAELQEKLLSLLVPVGPEPLLRLVHLTGGNLTTL